MERYVNVDRDTRMLLPVDMREWVAEEDMVHFVIESVEGMNLGRLKVNERGTGSAQYPPGMMLSLLIYCYASGIFSSRRIERSTYRDITVRYLTGNTHPDHDTIAKFRRDNFDAITECFVKTLELAKQLGILKVGTVSVDGTQIRANASKHKNVTYARAGEIREQLEADIRLMLEKAEKVDKEEENAGDKLPEELNRLERLRVKMQEARAVLENRARERAQAERAEYERKIQARQMRKGRCKGKLIHVPSEKPRGEEQINLVDEDSRLMRKNKRSSYEQCYNAQAIVDVEGSQLVVGARVSQCASDRNELRADMDAIPGVIGKPTYALADSGYACEEQVRAVEKEGVEVYVSTGRESVQQQRRYDYRPQDRLNPSRNQMQAPWLKRMKAKLETDVGRRLYRLRKQTVEPVFGIIKQAMGFRQFLLRGVKKVSGEWRLVTLAYNFKRMWMLRPAGA